MFALITKVNEGESNTPCPSTLEVTYTSVEKLSKVLINVKYKLILGRSKALMALYSCTTTTFQNLLPDLLLLFFQQSS
jgi:hypothetical protein